MPMCILYCILQYRMRFLYSALAAPSGCGGVVLKHLLPRQPSRGSRYLPDASRVHHEGNPEARMSRKPRKIRGEMHIALTSSLMVSVKPFKTMCRIPRFLRRSRHLPCRKLREDLLSPGHVGLPRGRGGASLKLAAANFREAKISRS